MSNIGALQPAAGPLVPLVLGDIPGVFALVVAGNGRDIVIPMFGAPLPATVTAYPVTGDTLLVEQSADNGDTFNPGAVLNATVLTSAILRSGCTHLRMQRTVGSGTTSYITIC